MTSCNPCGNGATGGSSAADGSSAGSSSVDAQLAKMSAAFDLATETNAKITVLKTGKGAEETAAQQRPNIG